MSRRSAPNILYHGFVFGTAGGGVSLEIAVVGSLALLNHATGYEFKIALGCSEVEESTWIY